MQYDVDNCTKGYRAVENLFLLGLWNGTYYIVPESSRAALSYAMLGFALGPSVQVL